MSRIAICVLAATASLIAGSALADRECFAGLCGASNTGTLPPRVAAAEGNAVATAGPRIVRAGYWQLHRRHYLDGQYPIAVRNLHVEVPGAIYPDGNVMSRYPYLQDDPSWRLCQTDRGEGRARPYECGPFSYHPFGTYGYRPNGTYVPSRHAPGYVLAPSAKVIRIEQAD